MKLNIKNYNLIKTSPKHSLMIGSGLLFLVMFSGCIQNDGGIERVEGDRVIAPDSDYYKMYGGDNPKFFTSDNPGKWKGREYEHLPVINFSEKNGNKFIKVSMNLEQRPDHYTEVIILLDQNHQEIAAVPFDIYLKGKPQTDFFLGKGEISTKFYVVAKCNKHDMWEVPVILTLEQAGHVKKDQK